MNPSTLQSQKDVSSFSLKILYDTNPSNPFEEWDCEPPLMYTYDRNTTHYGTETLASELYDTLSDYQWSRLFKKIAKDYPNVLDESDFQYKKESYGYTRPEYMREEILHGSELTEMETLELVCIYTKTPYLSTSSRGCSQGDYADVLIVLSPEFFKNTGANPKDQDEILKGTKKLFDSYIWGDVYGYQLTEHKPLYTADGTLSTETEDDIIDSCWGFYGDDGLNDIENNIPFDHKHLFKNAKDNIQY